MPSYEYKLTRSAGVLALRPTGRAISITGENVVTSEFVGVAIDDVNVWKITYVEGRTVLVDTQFGDMSRLVASRVNDPELGAVWYADATVAAIYINPNKILQYEQSIEVYYGDGETFTPSTGERVLLENGRSLVLFDALLIP
jgi:hypothetical protein